MFTLKLKMLLIIDPVTLIICQLKTRPLSEDNKLQISSNVQGIDQEEAPLLLL